MTNIDKMKPRNDLNALEDLKRVIFSVSQLLDKSLHESDLHNYLNSRNYLKQADDLTTTLYQKVIYLITVEQAILSVEKEWSKKNV